MFYTYECSDSGKVLKLIGNQPATEKTVFDFIARRNVIGSGVIVQMGGFLDLPRCRAVKCDQSCLRDEWEDLWLIFSDVPITADEAGNLVPGL